MMVIMDLAESLALGIEDPVIARFVLGEAILAVDVAIGLVSGRQFVPSSEMIDVLLDVRRFLTIPL